MYYRVQHHQMNQLMTYLTFNEYQELVPFLITDVQSPLFYAYVGQAADDVLGALPFTMQDVIRSGDFTGKPELKEYWETRLRKWLANQVWYTMTNLSSLQTTPEGVASFVTPQTREAEIKRINMQLVEIDKKVIAARSNALIEYQERKYVFDGIAYPPTRNMTGYWNDAYAGYSYLNGAYGWGYYNGSAYLGVRPSFGIADSQTFAVNFIGITAPS